MDGMERDLQYLAAVTAEHARADGFLREVLLDCEVSDVLKIEILRLLYARNEDNSFGVVICNIYRDLHLERVKIGPKRHKKFVEAYAKVASKFTIINDDYGDKIKAMTEFVYRVFLRKECWELANNSDDLACAIYLLCGLKEVGRNSKTASPAFDATPGAVDRIMAAVLSK